jgi:hypothetical protein
MKYKEESKKNENLIEELCKKEKIFDLNLQECFRMI